MNVPVPFVVVLVATLSSETLTANVSFMQPVKPDVFWTKPPAMLPLTRSVVQSG
ncbi:MAG: hypothetical protein ICV59_02945 [Thermoleophilia bacterium]|nr:hypothetical protein [Thermoleophilia bacterium]